MTAPIIDMNEKMIFIISSPRSGSTLLERMISSHTQIMGGPEPHLLTPLAHLGFYETVEKAPYDHLRAVAAQREFVAQLPGKENDYLDALRFYCNTLYSRLLQTAPSKTMLLDKTPAYALVLPFISKVYPNAKYLVLTRHPGAIFSSYADSFFEGDWKAAHDFNPIVERYVPAIARFLRETNVPFFHMKYEDLVSDPGSIMQAVCKMLKLPYEAGMIDYGKQTQERKGLGDPIGVTQHQRPVTSSIDKWVKGVKGDSVKEDLLRKMIGFCDQADLKTWGYPPEKIFDSLDSAKSGGVQKKKKKDPITKFRIERMILHKIRKNIHHNALGKLVRKIRFACDVLLR
jgi:hypothetical protein